MKRSQNGLPTIAGGSGSRHFNTAEGMSRRRKPMVILKSATEDAFSSGGRLSTCTRVQGHIVFAVISQCYGIKEPVTGSGLTSSGSPGVLRLLGMRKRRKKKNTTWLLSRFWPSMINLISQSIVDISEDQPLWTWSSWEARSGGGLLEKLYVFVMGAQECTRRS